MLAFRSGARPADRSFPLPAIIPVIRLGFLFAPLFALAPAAAASATESAAGDDPASGSPGDSAVVTYRMAPIRIVGEPFTPGVESLRERTWDRGLAINLADALTGIPGVSVVRRSAGGAEPVVRGLGWERVPVRVGGVCVSGACPSRMDPPASYFSPVMTPDVSVVTGIPSVSLGSGGTGGAVEIDPDFRREAGAGRELTFRWDEQWESSSGAVKSGGGVHGGTGRMDFRVSGEATRHHDYETGRGEEVPADRRSVGGAASAGWRPAQGQRLWAAWTGTRDEDVDFPALPMDTEESTLHVVNAGYRLEREGVLRALDMRGGWSTVDHLMSNANKPNRPMLEATTPSDANAASLEARVRVAGEKVGEWDAGLQATRLRRDATRTRVILSTGATFHDHLWPDASQDVAGAWVETERPWPRSMRLRLGARVDVYRSEAAAVDDPGGGGATIRNAYVRFHGDAAADVDRTEAVGSVQTLLRGSLTDDVTVHAGAGFSMRPAGVTERYFAFGPTPGGFQVGNPALAAERKWAFEVGAGRRGHVASWRATVFWNRLTDYILPRVVATQDVNGDGTVDRIRSFRNVDAELAGVEARFTWRPARGLEMPLQMSFVRGRNLSDERDLPEIPPLSAAAAVRWSGDVGRPLHLELASRGALRQPFVDREFPENESPAWATLSARAEVGLWPRVALRVGLENLLDAEYHEHLTREALMTAGDLAAGSEVPAPGRGVFLGLSAEF